MWGCFLHVWSENTALFESIDVKSIPIHQNYDYGMLRVNNKQYSSLSVSKGCFICMQWILVSAILKNW